MRLLALFCALGLLVLGVVGVPLTPQEADMARLLLARAALANAPDRRLIGGGSSYAPYQVSCPSSLTWIRPATVRPVPLAAADLPNPQNISSGEQSFLSQRSSVISSALNAQLSKSNITTPPRQPVLGMALSGGGYRAMQCALPPAPTVPCWR